MRALGYTTLEDHLSRYSATERAELEAGAARLLAEHLSLTQMRRARKLTQARLAKKLNVGQESISRLEQRTDLHLSTLRQYVEGMGGTLTLTVNFPDRPPVQITGIAALEEQPGPARKTSATKSKIGPAKPPAKSKRAA